MQPSPQTAFRRPAKAGVFFVLLLAVAAAGAVYWFHFRQPAAAPMALPLPAPASPGPVLGDPSAPPAKSGPGGPSEGKKPSSIFDDSYDGSTGTAAAPPPLTAPPVGVNIQVLQALEAANRQAAVALDAARAKARLSPAFVARQAEVDDLETRLKAARKSGTPDEKIALSSQWNKARLSLKADQDAAVETNPAVIGAKAAAAQAARNLSLLRNGK